MSILVIVEHDNGAVNAATLNTSPQPRLLAAILTRLSLDIIAAKQQKRPQRLQASAK
ncbi:MAG: hypothetical protein CM15mP119_2390 [Alphaproteobacteria bacterium]|nr:MAG: hypothetical protein CM15mP119_2390 [Alphaproteobacteria bacterium]